MRQKLTCNNVEVQKFSWGYPRTLASRAEEGGRTGERWREEGKGGREKRERRMGITYSLFSACTVVRLSINEALLKATTLLIKVNALPLSQAVI